ncbi:Hypothetical Protein FCC1311_003892 [Hondaea fermentalgiana]|uniref:BZIP domain-containing protein n=1 Tax=Hondaea fermentalgiana TaxID=2315210 RepID=A0A2R5G806_9STRA|nr:Hypothetical Protein FCC1311_003892 [Hondaea fermentalgiana]|eukprot:GBG24171.1 Hypothetical Protein FCC1311_003892 [Hondaea fermentalgiana]
MNFAISGKHRANPQNGITGSDRPRRLGVRPATLVFAESGPTEVATFERDVREDTMASFWDEDDGAPPETFYNGAFYPSELVLSPKDQEIISSASRPASEDEREEEEGDIDQTSSAAKDAISLVKSPTTSEPASGFTSAAVLPAAASSSDDTDAENRIEKGPAGSKARRRAIVAASSRATRAKRKCEREELQRRNMILEQEREMYLGRIAQLQTEVQAFRDLGAVNLQRENELLRVEIRKHRAFLKKLKETTTEAPNLTAEEQFRLIHSGSASVVGQVVGLVFTSVADKSWNWHTMKVPAHDGSAVECNVGLQALPLNCEARDSKRGNYRIDLPWRPDTPMDMKNRIWTAWSHPEVTAALYSPDMRNIKVKITEIPTGFEKVKRDGDPEMRVFRYLEENTFGTRQRREFIYTITWRATKLFTPTNFPVSAGKDQTATGASAYARSADLNVDLNLDGGYGATDQSDFDAEAAVAEAQAAVEAAASNLESGLGARSSTSTPRPAIDPLETVSADDPEASLIVCSFTTTDDVGLQPAQDGVHRIRAPLIEGHVLRPGTDGKGCLWTIIHSCPLLENGFAHMTPTQFVNDDFTIGPTAVALVNSNVRAMNSIELKK